MKVAGGWLARESKPTSQWFSFLRTNNSNPLNNSKKSKIFMTGVHITYASFFLKAFQINEKFLLGNPSIKFKLKIKSNKIS